MAYDSTSLREASGWAGALHLAGLSVMAIAQPIFDLLGRNPEFLVAHKLSRTEITVGALVLVLAPALSLAGLGAACARLGGATLEARVRTTVVALLLATLSQVGLSATSLPTPVVLTAGLATAIVAATLYARIAFVRSVLTVSAVAVVAAPVSFLYFSEAARVGRPGEAAAETAAPRRDLPSIVFAVFDELPLSTLVEPSGRIDAARFPAFARLAERSTWYREATSVANETSGALPAILTGRRPQKGRLPSFSDYPANLFTLLAPHYRMNVQEPMTQLCPPRSCGESDTAPERWFGTARDVAMVYGHLVLHRPLATVLLPDVRATWREFGTGARLRSASDWRSAIQGAAVLDRVAEFRRFVASLSHDAAPALHFVHTVLPHGPYEYLPDGRTYGRPHVEGLDGSWRDDPVAARLGYQRHLLQAMLADRLLGELVQRLERAELVDEVLLVVVADHGVSFAPATSHRRLQPANAADILSVPLFIKEPGQRSGAVSDEQVQTVDILPTLVARLGLTTPTSFEGRPMTAGAAHRPRIGRNDDGQLVELAAAPGAWRPSAVRKLLLFGDDAGEDAFFVFPGYRNVVGRQVAELACSEPGFVEGGLQSSEVHNVPGSGHVSAYLEGRVAAGAAGSPSVVVAVDGVVAAGTEALAGAGGTRGFALLLPPHRLPQGTSAATAYLVRSTPGGRCLATLGPPMLTPTWRLEPDRLVGSDGTSALLGSTLAGWVDVVTYGEDVVEVLGWAADREKRDLPRAVVATLDHVSIASGRTSSSRLDVVGAFHEDAFRYSGFRLSIPTDEWRDPGAQLRVFAVSVDGRATELGYSAGVRRTRAEAVSAHR